MDDKKTLEKLVALRKIVENTAVNISDELGGDPLTVETFLWRLLTDVGVMQMQIDGASPLQDAR